MAACKIPGIRASVCHDTYSAHQAVEHDDLNVLCLGARVIGGSVARGLVEVFLAAQFSGEARHMTRLAKIDAPRCAILALPLKLAGLDGAPARVVAIEGMDFPAEFTVTA